MAKRQAKAERFRVKGSNILNDHPCGINDFLNDSPSLSKNTQIHKPSIPQKHTSTFVEKQEGPDIRSPKFGNEALGRLHLQIRQNLIDKLIDEVFNRKRDPTLKGCRATQRSVIEEALEHYFESKSVPNETAEEKKHI